jgi:putative ABC transport system permease protein
LPRHLALFVLAEALTIGALGGGLGLALGYPFVNNAIGRFLEENMGGFFPYFRVEPTTALAAMLLALAFSLVAAAIPAYRVTRLQVTDALRRVG